jgi:hypothetical protein
MQILSVLLATPMNSTFPPVPFAAEMTAASSKRALETPVAYLGLD